MSRLAWALVPLLAGVAALPQAAKAQEPPSPPPVGAYGEVELHPEEGTTIWWRGRPYGGILHIDHRSDGLVLVEEIDVDGYLAGIKEVPLDWPAEALAAQAVAARTYLAWTLDRGRSSSGDRYGFDICATDRCQVYAGAGVVLDDYGDRWAEAIERTTGQLLLFEGRPAQALYHSTSGGRTEPVQDIFSGSAPAPYLQGADSPGEESPWNSWDFVLPAGVFVEILRAGGVDVGSSLLDATVVPRGRGRGVWEAAIDSTTGVIRLPVDRLRAVMNVHGPDRYPALLPARRPGGGRYPQAVLSYRFTLDFTPPPDPVERLWASRLPLGDGPALGTVRFSGSGWGHHVGMSQYGAKAMADAGRGYGAILAHYYGGLEPTDGGGRLPDRVRVGLAWDLGDIEVEANGPFQLVLDGRAFSAEGDVGWRLFPTASGQVGLFAPDLLLPFIVERFGRLLPLL